MEAVKRIAGSFLILVAIAIVAQAIIPGGRHDLWTYLNPLMAVSILLVVAIAAWSQARKSGGAGDESSSRKLFETGFEPGFVFYLGLFIAYLFFYNWIKELNEGEGHSWVWIVLNGMIPVLNVWAGIRLWNRRS